MKAIIPSSSLGLLLGLASIACSGGDLEPDVAGNDAVESVGTEEQAQPTCEGPCVKGCYCPPIEDHPCFPKCSRATKCGAPDGCGGFCSGGVCKPGMSCGGGGIPNQCGCSPSCGGQTCGAADGCGGICGAGSCPAGGVCGGGGAPGACAQPDLQPFVNGTLDPTLTLVRHADWQVRVYNLSPVPVSNIEILVQTNMGAQLSSLNTGSSGFVCHTLPAFAPRLGMTCTGGSIPANSSTVITLSTALTTNGAPTPHLCHVLSVIADPNALIVESFENNNTGNNSVCP